MGTCTEQKSPIGEEGMKRKITGIVLLVSALFYSAVGIVFADTGSTAEVHNYVRTGDIDISLKQYDKQGKPFTDGLVWIPGDRIENRVEIENQAKSCWIRVKAEKDQVIQIKGISEQWIYREPYWYYTEVLEEHGKATFSESFFFSERVPEKTSGEKDSVEMTAEAIQSAHFIPDFHSESPWGEQTAELCVHVKNGTEQDIKRSYQNLSLTMEERAGELVAVPKDFFVNLSELMPGDRQSDCIEVSNQFKERAELFFRTADSPDMTEQQKELLERLEFWIYKNDELIYEGNVRSMELQKEISLGIWDSNEKGSIRYEIFMPEELKNEYAVRDAEIHWIFRTDLEKEHPKTGDDGWAVAYLALAAISGGFGFWKMVSGKKQKEHQRKESI